MAAAKLSNTSFDSKSWSASRFPAANDMMIISYAVLAPSMKVLGSKSASTAAMPSRPGMTFSVTPGIRNQVPRRSGSSAPVLTASGAPPGKRMTVRALSSTCASRARGRTGSSGGCSFPVRVPSTDLSFQTTKRASSAKTIVVTSISFSSVPGLERPPQLSPGW